MTQRTGVLTIISKNYLAFARTLMASVRKHRPEAIGFVILVDDLNGEFNPDSQDFIVLPSEMLDIPDSAWFRFKYSILELNTAVKPYAIDYLFKHHNLDRILYFDPDVWIVNSLAPLEAVLDEWDIVLTPHLTTPLPDDDKVPSELNILRAGAYNLGFIGIADTPNSRWFLKWWQRKLHDHCYVDLNDGLFTDQKWVDLVPGLFDRVHVTRDASFNTAYWNLSHRTVSRAGNRYTVNGLPLCFFHFSGLDPLDPELFSKHQDRFSINTIGDARDLALEYSAEVLANGHRESRRWPYAYGTFRNGEPIADYCRRFGANAPEIVRRVRDPFSAAGFAEYFGWWTAPVNPGAESIPRIAYDIYVKRPDVRHAYPDIHGADRVAFLQWFIDSAQREYYLPDHFLTHVRGLLSSSAPHSPERAPGADSHAVCVGPGASFRRLLSRVDPRLYLPLDAKAIAWLIGTENGSRLPRIARIVYSDRKDLHAEFPQPDLKDSTRFLSWMITYGQREYGFPPEVVNALEKELNTFGFWRRLPGVKFPLQLTTRMISPNRRLRPSDPACKQTGADDPELPGASAGEDPRGLNVVGYLRSRTGVGEASRCTIAAADAAHIPVSFTVFEIGDISEKSEYNSVAFLSGFRYDINLFNVNADQTSLVFSSLERSAWAMRYNIGHWNWELENLPDQYSEAFSFLDEVWAPTAFCQDAFSRRSPLPVVRMPYAVEPAVDPAMNRGYFSLPAGDFLFLTMFDVLSIVARKNPHGVIRAFRAMHCDYPNSRLVLKINNGDRLPVAVAELRAACEGLPVCIIDHSMSRTEVNGLVACCDCLISLHRSEGYGFALAEAMYLGKPVIATAYSGNMDFTTHDNSFLVDYQLTPVGPGCQPYPEGSRWAEPNTRSAVEHMRTVRKQPEIAHSVALKGQAFVRENLSAGRVGQRMAERLQQIRSRSRFRITSEVFT